MGGSGQTLKAALSEPAKLAVVREKLAEGANSRTRLAAELCRRFRFRDARGELRVGSCLKALRDLERVGELTLPPRLLDLHGGWSPRRLPAAVAEAQGVPERVEWVRGLCVVLVDPADDAGMRTWNELMLREHPWGGASAGGAPAAVSGDLGAWRAGRGRVWRVGADAGGARGVDRLGRRAAAGAP